MSRQEEEYVESVQQMRSNFLRTKAEIEIGRIQNHMQLIILVGDAIAISDQLIEMLAVIRNDSCNKALSVVLDRLKDQTERAKAAEDKLTAIGDLCKKILSGHKL